MNQKYRSYRGEVANEAVSPKYAHTFGIKTLESLKHRIDRERTCNGGCIVAVYNVHAGHNPAGKIAQGAVGLLNESKENRLIKDEMIRYLRIGGNTVYWYVRDGAVDFAYNGEIKVKIVGGNVRLG